MNLKEYICLIMLKVSTRSFQIPPKEAAKEEIAEHFCATSFAGSLMTYGAIRTWLFKGSEKAKNSNHAFTSLGKQINIGDIAHSDLHVYWPMT